MTLTYQAGGNIKGLSTDTKPTLIPTGTRFFETDSKTEFMYDGTLWRTLNYRTRDIIRKEANFCVNASATTNGYWDTRITNAIVGTGSGTVITDSTGTYRSLATGATINSLSDYYMTLTLLHQRIANPILKWKFKISATASIRLFLGFTTNTSAPVSSADPLNAQSGMGLWLDSAVSANWQIMHNSGTGASTVDSTGIASNTSIHTVEIIADDTNTRFIFNLDGTYTNVTTVIPAQTTGLGMATIIENTTGTNVSVNIYAFEGEILI